ncbi:MAG: D-tyrosyl-tRNA(Tyr) deacylase [Candidatus Omnitrophica bacterium]|nr:D-tyrosyl-tRNA(Tyr) deacylase [Candidatus Omnitrophota bacterium]
MRLVIQRVKYARVSVGGKIVSEIGIGFLILVGVGREDSEDDIMRLAKKVSTLRIFEDNNGKMNMNIQNIKGEILSVPQFTLYADTTRGNRPGFEQAAGPRMADELWQKFNNRLKEMGLTLKTGLFGEHMEIELVNDGPVTIIY